MVDVRSDLAPNSPSDAKLDIRHLQRETIVLVLPALFVTGWLFLLCDDLAHDPMRFHVPAFLFFFLPALVWALRSVNYLASAWTLAIGCLGAVVFYIMWGGNNAAGLLAIPAGLAALFVSLQAGIVMAAGATLFAVVAAGNRLLPDPSWPVMVSIQVWGTVGLIGLTARPLLTAMEWSWSSYRRSIDLLEQARDYQVRLKQTLADLTQANEQLARANEKLAVARRVAEEAERVKAAFVANVSHELRTPLNMIIGFSEMITKWPETYGSPLPPALLSDLSVILRNSQHLSDLIDDVLDLSQIETGRMALTKERVALPDIVEAAKTAVRRLYATKGLRLESEVAADLPLVLCDPTRIREVILNLLSNAARFTERGGVRIRVWREGNDVVVAVADTGPGIPPQDINKLFRPFQQADGSIRRRYGGTGLGLSISKSLVELHGGTMWIESTLGSGSTVYFRLPIDPPMLVEKGASAWVNPAWDYVQRTHPSRAPHPVVRPQVLVMEPGNTLGRLLSRYLEGVEIVPVPCLAEASAYLAQAPVRALVINDASVVQTLQHIADAQVLPEGTPAIVCSLLGTPDAAQALRVS